MNRTLLLGIVFVTAVGSACSTPQRPYGQPDYVPEQIEPYRPVATPRPTAKRVLVLGAFDDLSIQPVGGLYNEVNYSMGPLLKTYSYWALVPKLKDELHRAMKKRGVSVMKDYLDLGQPIPYPSSTFAKGLLVLRGSIDAFGFSRHVQGFDVLLGRLTLRLVSGDSGEVLWRTQQSVAIRVPITTADPFYMFADTLAAQIFSDPEFVRVISGGV